VTSAAAHRAVEAVWRIEAARLIAGLARLIHDVGRAEDLAQDALVAALEQWPTSGIPDRPGAWLMTVAKRRAVDEIRRDVTLAGKVELLGRELPEADELELPGPVEDDVLRLMFTACHPVLTPEAQAALTLKMLAGLTTDEIARAFLVPTATMAQRIVRAKRTLAEARVGFESPGADELAPRLAAVLAVVYLVFNEGYSATAGEDLVRPALCDEAMRLGRILAALVPDEPEVHGLLAMMELQASRLRARTGPDGAIVTLLDQDRGRWDQLLIHRGLAGLARAEQLGGAAEPYAVQAAIAAVHARARTADATDWPRIAALYAVLARVAPSPVVELNRAVAVSMADGPAAALELVDGLEGGLDNYYLLPSVRGDLLAKLGRPAEARAEFERAAGLTANERERDLLLAGPRSVRERRHRPARLLGLAAGPQAGLKPGLRVALGGAPLGWTLDDPPELDWVDGPADGIVAFVRSSGRPVVWRAGAAAAGTGRADLPGRRAVDRLAASRRRARQRRHRQRRARARPAARAGRRQGRRYRWGLVGPTRRLAGREPRKELVVARRAAGLPSPYPAGRSPARQRGPGG